MQPPTSRSADRVDFVDALRGFALFGVFGANLLIFSGFIYMTDDHRATLPTARVDHMVELMELIFIENKFMGLFSFLFGVSFWLFLDRARMRGADGIRLFYRRLVWLFVIGAVHAWLFWLWDILRFYALWGLLLPLFLRITNKVLLSLALFFAVLAPALIGGLRSLLIEPAAPREAINALALATFSSGGYGEVLQVNWLYDWDITFSVSQIAYQVAVFGRLLLGLYAARLLLHIELERHQKLFRVFVIGGAIIGIPFNLIIALRYFESSVAGSFVVPFTRRLIAQSGYLALTLAYASALALLFQKYRWRRYLLMFVPVGRMALTCYLFQTLLGLWVFYGFMPGPDLMGTIGPTWLVPVWVIGYLAQVWLASVWLRHFRFGPAEWLWRSLTYWKPQSLRAGTAAPN